MAVTSLWHVKGSIKDVIDYIENPEKTVPNREMQDFFDVFSYVKNPLKTNEGGYIAWHGYQSFKPDEVTPEQCHEIGLKLAMEMWGAKYQIIVATHLDKGHLHNHFCFNSVSYIQTIATGQTYCYNRKLTRQGI